MAFWVCFGDRMSREWKVKRKNILKMKWRLDAYIYIERERERVDGLGVGVQGLRFELYGV